MIFPDQSDGVGGKNPTSIFEIESADGVMAADWKKRKLRYVAVFWAALRTSQRLPLRAGNRHAGEKQQ